MELADLLAKYKLQDGEIVNKNGRAVNQEEPLWQEWNRHNNTDPMAYIPFKTMARLHLARKNSAIDEMALDFKRLETGEEIVLAALKDRNIEIRNLGGSFYQKGESIMPPVVKNVIVAFHEEYNRSIPVNSEGKKIQATWSTQYIQAKFSEVLSGIRTSRSRQLKESLRYGGGDPFEAVKIIMDAMGIQGNKKLASYAFCHWMWNVKRLMYDMKMNHPLMLSIFGAQGKGKSHFIKHNLCKPFEEFYIEASLKTLADEREVGKWTQYWVVNFDELSTEEEGRLSTGMLATIKRKLTEEDITVRVMNTHDQAQLKRTFGAIGTSNSPLSRVIGDSTGMRRFFEMESQCEGAMYDIEKLESVNYVELWRSVDEDMENGYLHPGSTCWSDLQIAQESYIPLDAVDCFIREGKFQFLEGGLIKKDEMARLTDYESFAGRAMYKGFEKFRETFGFRKLNYTTFIQRISERNLAIYRPRPGSLHFVVKNERRT